MFAAAQNVRSRTDQWLVVYCVRKGVEDWDLERHDLGFYRTKSRVDGAVFQNSDSVSTLAIEQNLGR